MSSIKLKRSSIQGRVPTTSNLELGELAINTYDGKIFIKKNQGGTETVVDLTNASNLDGLQAADFLRSNQADQAVSLLTLSGGALFDTANVDLSDTVRLNLGDSDDFSIYHDGNNSYLDESGQGSLIVKATNFYIRSSSNESKIDAISDGAVKLYHDNVLRLETTAAGITVTGEVSANTVVDVDYIDFLTNTGTPTYQEGRLFYDDTRNVLAYYDNDSDLVHELGIEEMQKVYNDTGSTITKGTVLYFSGNYTGAEGDVPTVGLADASSEAAYNAQGLAAADIAPSSYGYCQISGVLSGFDTSHVNAPANFFASPSTPGSFQNASPTYPNFPMCLGWVVKSDATNGAVLINQQNHSVNSFRVRTDTHIAGDLILGGNLTVLGSQTIASTETVAINNPFTYVNGGDTIGILNTSFSGTGLDDASLTGKFTGPVQTTYYVRIDGVGTGTNGVDTFEWSTDNFATTVATGVDIDGTDQLIHSTDNIAIKFESTTGHTLGDTWTGTAAPSNVDTGFITNRNTGQSAPGFTYMGLYFDVSQGKWVLFDEFDTEPSGAIDTTDTSFSYAALKLENVDADNIDIGTHIDFTSQVTHPTHQAGRVFYSNEYKALTVYNDITGSSLQVGHEEWIRVYNNTGSTIPNGTPVYDTGAFGETITVAPADATTAAKAAVLGIATHDIPTSSEGVVTVRGLLSGINTASLTVGSKIHLAPNGTIQNAAPTYPYYPTDLGWCVVSDATDGYIYVTIEHHTYEQFRVTGNQHIDGNLTVDGDLIISGTQSIVSSTNLSIDDSFIYIGTGDAIGESGTAFSGSGLDDAYFRGYFEGAASTTYYVRIDGVGTGTGGADTFEWSTDNFASTVATGVSITGASQALSENISIFFNATTGHTSGDTWSGTAAPVNVDSGWVANRNTGTTGVGYTHMGVFFDVSDNKFKFFDEYDPEVTGDINVGDASFSYANVVVDTLTGNVIGNLTGNVTGDVSGDAGTVGGLTASQFLRSDANDTATGIISLYSGGATNTFNVGRNTNEKFQFYVTDTQGYIDYIQDETDTSDHTVNFRITSTSTGANQFKFNRPLYYGTDRVLTTADTEWLEDSANTIFQGGTYITKVHADASNTITFNHDATTRTNNTSTASPAFGGTFTAIDSITTNATGHVTAVNTKTITVPSEADTLQSVTTRGNTTDTNILFSDNKILGRNTVDASDNGYIAVVGGGAESDGRGAIIRYYGNEHATNAGELSLASGNVTGGKISMRAGGTSDVVTVTSSGVGINNSSPLDKLSVAHDATAVYSSSAIPPGMRLTNHTTGDTVNQAVGIQFQATSLSGTTTGVAGISAVQYNKQSSADLVFQNRNAGTIFETMRIGYQGNVGIGDASPSNKLVVDVNSASTGTDSISVRNSDVTTVGHTVGQRFQFNSAVPAAIRTTLTNVTTGAGRLGLFTSTDGTSGNLVERLSVTSDGKVGIGTATPQAPLQVASSSTNVAPLVLQGPATNGMVLIGHNYLGNNEYYNTQGLDYSTNAWMIGSGVYVDSATSRKQLSTQDNYVARGASLYVDGNTGVIDFYTSSVQTTRTKDSENTDIARRFRIAEDGNVAVGDHDPSYKLHLKNTTGVTRLQVETASADQASLALKNSEGEFQLVNDGGELSFYDAGGGYHAGKIDTVGHLVWNKNIIGSGPGPASGGETYHLTNILANASNEEGHFHHPFLNNSWGHFIERGGTLSYAGLSSAPSSDNSARMFQATSQSCTISTSTITGSTFDIIMTNVPTGLSYGAYGSITFGNASWAPVSITVFTSTDNGSTWTQRYTSSETRTNHWWYWSSGGTQTNAMKITLGVPSNGSSMRINNITAYNYSSWGPEQYFLPLRGGKLYGDLDVQGSPLAPASTGTAQTGSLRLSQTSGSGVLDMGFYTSTNGTAWLQSTNKANLAQNYDLALQPNGGNVGIGVTAPSEKLEVAGNISVGTGSQWLGRDSQNNSFGFNASTGQYINSTASIELAIDSNNGDNDIRFFRIIKNAYGFAGGTELFKVTEAGNATVAGDLTVGGDLTINGSTTTLNVTNLEVDDAVILLNAGQATPANDIGLVFQRYSTTSAANTNVGIIWDEGNDSILFGSTQEDASDTDVTIDTSWLTISSNGNIGVGTTGPVRDLHINKTNASGQVRLQVENNDNTSATSHSVISIYSGGASGGDPFLHWKVDAVQDWSIGIDNSDADKLKISKNFGPGTNDYFIIDTNGNTQLNGDLTLSGTVPKLVLNDTNNSHGGGAQFHIDFNTSGGIQSYIGVPSLTDNNFYISTVKGGAGGRVADNTSGSDIYIEPRNTLEIIGKADSIDTDGLVHAFKAMKGANPLVHFEAGYVSDTSYTGHGSVLDISSSRGDGFADGYLLRVRNADGGTSAPPLFVRGDRKVGVGTATPAADLHIRGGTGDAQSTTVVIGGSASADTNHTSTIELRETINASNQMTYGFSISGDGGSTNNLLFRNFENSTTGNIAMSVDRGTGNVGIGVSDAATALHVYDSTASTGSTGTTLLTLDNYVGSDLSQQKTFIDFRLFDDNTNETPQVRIGAEVGTNSDADSQQKEGSGAFVIYTNNADTTSGAAGASLVERMRVDYLGNVGIGTTNPTGGRLHVDGGSAYAAHFETTSDITINLASSNTWTGIRFNDSSAVHDDLWHNGTYGTFAMGGGGSAVSGKKLHVDGGVTIGSGSDAVSMPSNGLYVEGNIDVGGRHVLAGNSGTSTATATVFTLFAHASFGAAKIIVTAKNGVNRQITELLITHDGTTAVATEYGQVATSGIIAEYEVAINGANVELTATSSTSSGIVYNIVKTLID